MGVSGYFIAYRWDGEGEAKSRRLGTKPREPLRFLACVEPTKAEYLQQWAKSALLMLLEMVKEASGSARCKVHSREVKHEHCGVCVEQMWFVR